MTKLENTLSNFSEKPEILKHIDKADQLKTRDAVKEYGKRHKIWDNETFKGYYESTEHIKPETYDDYRSRAAKYGAITKAENKTYGKDMSDEGKPGDKKSKLKKALKVAGTVGAIGALGAAGAIAGDALNLWDLGKVEGIAGKVLSPLDKAGNALNAMASAPAVNQLNEQLNEYKSQHQKLVDDIARVGLSYDQGNKIHIHPSFGDNGNLGFHVSTMSPEGPVDIRINSTIPMDTYRKLLPTSRSYK